MTINAGRESITGRVYLERGEAVTVLARWAAPRPRENPGPVAWLRPPGRAPRNVLIRRAGGELTIRPFRGLRKPAATGPPGQEGDTRT